MPLNNDVEVKDRAEATKRIIRARHRLVMDLARGGKARTEIVAMCTLIDWNQEIEWMIDDVKQEREKLEAAKKAGPVAIPGHGPMQLGTRIEIPPEVTGAGNAVDAEASGTASEQKQPA
jgi:hypothetical protein